MGSAIQQSGLEDDADEVSPRGTCTFHRGLSFCSTPPREKVHRDTVVIFDWDDTLMCSTALREEYTPSSKELRQLGEAVRCLLLKAIGLGRTAIVTNANLTWVQASANLFIPAILPVLPFVQIVSARQNYHERWPGNFDKWKTEAFRDVVAGRGCTLEEVSDGLDDMNDIVFDDDAIDAWHVLGCDPLVDFGLFGNGGSVNLVVLGDSMVEMRAGRSALGSYASSWSGAIVKTVKFKTEPSVLDLVGQLQVVSNNFQRIVDEERNLSKKLVHGNDCGWLMKDR